jgi:hypothetical protein
MRITASLSVALTLALSACRPESRPDPRGSYPDAGTGTVAREESEDGRLTVETVTIRVNQDGRCFEDSRDPNWYTSLAAPGGYSIFDREGRPVADVPNHSPLVVTPEGPTAVPLAPGRYLVRLDRPVGNVRTFWVTIEPRGHTVVDPAGPLIAVDLAGVVKNHDEERREGADEKGREEPEQAAAVLGLREPGVHERQRPPPGKPFASELGVHAHLLECAPI